MAAPNQSQSALRAIGLLQTRGMSRQGAEDFVSGKALSGGADALLARNAMTSGSGGASGVWDDLMAQMQLMNTDLQNAITIQYQMMAANNPQAMQRWKILQDAQAKTFGVNQDVTLNQARTAKKLFDKWETYVQGR